MHFSLRVTSFSCCCVTLPDVSLRGARLRIPSPEVRAEGGGRATEMERERPRRVAFAALCREKFCDCYCTCFEHLTPFSLEEEGLWALPRFPFVIRGTRPFP